MCVVCDFYGSFVGKLECKFIFRPAIETRLEMIQMEFNKDLSIIAVIVNGALNGKRMDPVKVHSIENDKAFGPVIGQEGITMIGIIADSTDVWDFHPILIIHDIVILRLKG